MKNPCDMCILRPMCKDVCKDFESYIDRKYGGLFGSSRLAADIKKDVIRIVGDLDD